MSTIALSALILLSVTSQSFGKDEKAEFLIAFHCGSPTLHMTNEGWALDNKTDCLTSNEDILSYCKKVYPTVDVRNFAEFDQEITVKNWCDFFGENCDRAFEVLPIQCLSGPFVEEILVVPDRCVTDRVFDSRVCKASKEWKITASKGCNQREMIVGSFSILKPCDIGQFSGVQFVCCPQSDEVSVELVNSWPALIGDVNLTTDSSSDAVNEPESEHARYIRVKAELRRQHDIEISRIMAAWDEAQEEVMRMRGRDPEMAEKLERKITARFQKTISSLEERGEEEKQHINSIHDRNVEMELNVKKRKAMEAYLEVLSRQPSATLKDVYHVLKHYVRVEQKDRMHVINHYIHLNESDPLAAESVSSLVVEHLRAIRLRLNRSFEMLNRVPAYKNEIIHKIQDVLDEYKGFDDLEASILDVKTTESWVKVNRNNMKKEMSVLENDEIGLLKESETRIILNGSNVAENEQAVQLEQKKKETEKETANFDRVEKFKLKSTETDDFMEIRPANHPSHLGADELHLEEKKFSKSELKSSSSVGPLALVIATSVFLVTIMLLGAVVWRRYVETRRIRDGPRDDSRLLASSKQAHFNNMQVNGYENPTYKYFEANLGI